MGLLDKLFGKKKDKLFGKKKDNSSAETAIPEAETGSSIQSQAESNKESGDQGGDTAERINDSDISFDEKEEIIEEEQTVAEREDWKTTEEDMLRQAGRIPKDAEDYRREGLALEKQEKYEEAFLKYEEAAKMDDTSSMICIARMYLSGKFRPVDSSNLAYLLLQGGPVFPWSLQEKKRPDYKSGLEWLTKAADLGNGVACEIVGNMLCNGIGCETDIEKGISYLEKAAAHGQETAKKYICLYRPDGKVLTDEEYETALADFEKAADAGDDKAYELYSTLKSGTQKQLARLGHVLIAAQNIQKSGYEAFKYSSTPSGIPLIPVAPKRRAWRTFLRFNLDAWVDEHPLIAVASDILSIGDSRQIGFMLDHLHRAKIVGTVAYRSPSFGWLPVEKDAVLIRLGTDDKLNDEVLKEIADEFDLLDEEYRGDSIAFMFENGEKEYSFEVVGIKGDQVEVLYRYTVGGSEEIREYNEPELMSLHFYEDGKESGKEPHLFRYRIKGGNAVLERYQGSDTEVQVPDCVDGYKVVRIGDYCFARCSFITSVALPDTVKNIGKSVFSGCSSLTSITLPDSLTMIGEGAFERCIGLTSITIPSGVTYIDVGAFKGCSGLTSITLPSGVRSIVGYTFSDCRGLTSITLPDSLKGFGIDAFARCSSLTSITIPSGVKYFRKGIFASCSGLRSITLPKDLIEISENAFEGCNLKDVWYTGSRDQWEKIITDHGRCLLVPDIIFGNATIHFSS